MTLPKAGDLGASVPKAAQVHLFLQVFAEQVGDLRQGPRRRPGEQGRKINFLCFLL